MDVVLTKNPDLGNIYVASNSTAAGGINRETFSVSRNLFLADHDSLSLDYRIWTSNSVTIKSGDDKTYLTVSKDS